MPGHHIDSGPSGVPCSEKQGSTECPSYEVTETGDSSVERTIADHADSHNVSSGEGLNLPLSKIRCIALVITVAGASFLNTLSSQAMVLVLPTIGREIGIPYARQQWIVSAYSLTFGCFLLPWGRLADIYGKRTIFILGSGLVTVTTIANPFLPNEIAFDLFRGLQGLGAAANVPTAIGILGVTFPPGKAKNYAFSVYSAGFPLGSIFGNVLSGVMASFTSWKWVFGVLAAMAAVITIAGILFIPQSPKIDAREHDKPLLKSVDILGSVLITGGLVVLLFALTEGNIVGWDTFWIYILIVTALLLIAAFAVWQWYQEKYTSLSPLMKISVFKSGRFSAAMLIMFFTFSAFNTWIYYATILFQDYQGLSPIQTTLRFLPAPIAGILTSFAISRLISIIPTWKLLLMGNCLIGLTLTLYAIPIPPHTSYFAYAFPGMIFTSLGLDTIWPCLTLFTSESLPEEHQALGGGLINASGQIGRAISLAIATAIQTTVMAKERGVPLSEDGEIEAWEPASLDGIRAANWLGFVFSVCTICIVIGTFRGTGIVGRR